MKKINKLFTVVLFAALSVISCKNNFSELENEFEYTTEKAYLSFGINESEGRMVAPVALTWDDVSSIELTKDGAALKSWTSYAQMQADTSVVIDAGTYTFEVFLKNTAGDILQTGKLENVEIKAGNNSLNFMTKACKNGKGILTVKYSVDKPGNVKLIQVFLDGTENSDFTVAANPSLPFQDNVDLNRSAAIDSGYYMIKIDITDMNDNKKTVIRDFIEIQDGRETVFNYYYDEAATIYPVKFYLDDGNYTPVSFKESAGISPYATSGDLPSIDSVTNNLPDGCTVFGWYYKGENITKFPEGSNETVELYLKYGKEAKTLAEIEDGISKGIQSYVIIPEQKDWEEVIEKLQNAESLTVVKLDLSNITLDGTYKYFYHKDETYTERKFANIEEIIFPANLTTIEESTFVDNKSLKYVRFPDNSQLESIGKWAFNYCESLKKVTIGNNSSLKTIGTGAFSGSTLQTISFGENSQLNSIGAEAFNGCTALEEIVIPKGVIELEEKINKNYFGNTFMSCTSLKKVTFEEGTKLTTIGKNVFKNCFSLKEIVIPATVTKIGEYAFEYCSSLQEIEIPQSVTTIENSAFSECDNLKKYTIPSSLATYYDFADKLKSEDYKFKLIVNGNITKKNAFEENKGIVEIEILKNVTSISQYAFQYCQNLKKVSFEEGSKLKRIDNSIFYHCDKLEEIVIPASVTTIGDGVFTLCISLKEIVIPASVTSIEKSAFMGCKGLSKVTFEENSKLTIISDSLFYDCNKLTGIVLPATITTIENEAFGLCHNLQKIDIPAAVTSIGDYAFENIGNLSIKYLGGKSNITFGGDKVFVKTTVTELPLNE